MRGRILPARDRVYPGSVSGLVVQVRVTILLGVEMGRRAGAMVSKCWLLGSQYKISSIVTPLLLSVSHMQSRGTGCIASRTSLQRSLS